ncbi:MAG: YebC/PmpR family DNA-binding transcriptional regulator [Candidatus Berkelbacteria bacterium]|nr:YebC/PmpR family DNA-binding transcriptional regulator [Candidatus Berkelbacteria bacterium]
MSGHSKWATTKHKKAIVDAKRSASFTKLSKIVTIAARGGGDPTMNFSLRLAIDRAKAASMPKENIEKAIKRGTGEIGGAAIEEIVYEGYGPAGIAIIIVCLTDNRLRTVSEIRSIFNKFGGTLAEAGGVAYLFEKRGEISLSRPKADRPVDEAEKIEEKIIDSGALDFELEDDTIYIVYTELTDLQKVANYFVDAGIKIESSDIIYQPKTKVQVPEEKMPAVEKLLNALEELDDVSEVFSNIE